MADLAGFESSSLNSAFSYVHYMHSMSFMRLSFQAAAQMWIRQ